MSAFPYQRILAVGAHADDIELGCGATLRRAIRAGARVHVVCFSAHDPWFDDTKFDVAAEWSRALDALGVAAESRELHRFLGCRDDDFQRRRGEVLAILERARDRFRPDCVLVHSSTDTNQDHQTVHAEAKRAFKRSASILGYEFPNNNLSFDGRCFVLCDEGDVRAKQDALDSYVALRSQWEKRNDHYELDTISYLDERATFALAAMRGIQAGGRFAECLEVLRLLHSTREEPAGTTT